MTTINIPTASIWQQARTILANLFGDEPVGATAEWHPLADLPPATAELTAAPVQALTGELLTTVTDELGRWVPDLYDLEPARIFDAVLLGTDAGAPFRAGAAA